MDATLVRPVEPSKDVAKALLKMIDDPPPSWTRANSRRAALGLIALMADRAGEPDEPGAPLATRPD